MIRIRFISIPNQRQVAGIAEFVALAHWKKIAIQTDRNSVAKGMDHRVEHGLLEFDADMARAIVDQQSQGGAAIELVGFAIQADHPAIPRSSRNRRQDG